ncbi:MAG: HAD family hydrolase [Eubacterium sp.]|nr:HAD family hydrolase [Eubacterium sp.]
MYQTIIFDLDGTISDSGLGIMNTAVHTLEKFGITVSDRSELRKFIGPPLQYSFSQFYGLSEEDTAKAVAYYRAYYSEKGLYENTLYDGMADLLRKLHEEGYRLIVATSKLEPFAVRILQHFGVAQYFTFIAGSNADTTRSSKEEVLAYALEKGNVTDRTSAVMVGDREYDIIGAKAAGLDSVGVLYGYGSRKELEAAGATYIAPEVPDLLRILHRACKQK